MRFDANEHEGCVEGQRTQPFGNGGIQTGIELGLF